MKGQNTNMNVKVGSSYVYPHHGAVTVMGIRTGPFKEHQTEFLQLEVNHDGLRIEIPRENAEAIGMREPVGQRDVRRVFSILGSPAVVSADNWSKRFKANTEIISNGDIFTLSEVIRDMSQRTHDGKASAGEKRQLEQAMRILVSELILSVGKDADGVRGMIEDAVAPTAA